MHPIHGCNKKNPHVLRSATKIKLQIRSSQVKAQVQVFLEIILSVKKYSGGELQLRMKLKAKGSVKLV